MGIPDGSCGPFYRHRQVLRAAICLPSRVWILCGVRRQEYRGPLASDDFLGGGLLFLLLSFFTIILQIQSMTRNTVSPGRTFQKKNFEFSVQIKSD